MVQTSRTSTIQRRTKETDVSVTVDLDGSGSTTVDTGLAFLDHMIASFGKHAMLDLNLKSESLDSIHHHLVEDTAITLGAAIDEALGDREGITRFGYASVPLDESLAETTMDLVRRPFVRASLSLSPGTDGARVEDVAKEDLDHFFQSLFQSMTACVHLCVRYGENDHHKAEAAIKSAAVALRTAAAPDSKRVGAPSTKGSMG